MDRLCTKVSLILTLMASLLLIPSPWASADASPPAAPVKLIFIHHSTGGNWLADPNEDQPDGGLGAALMQNNYRVSATNYGWGPDGIGDRTDIPNWPEWFTGTGSAAVLAALYSENGQNVGNFGAWPRLAADPGGENTIVLFKSCFPNSDLYGQPDDPPATEPNDQFTVANAKAVYNDLLTCFAARPDKLFVAVTAPPQVENEYGSDEQPASQRAANARAFNNWLVHDWLAGYPHANVAVFDYFNVLTHPDNHHRVVAATIEHTTSAASGNFADYPSKDWDSHPNSAGHRKATAEFVPLLNFYYNTFTNGSPVLSKPAATTGAASGVTADTAVFNGVVNPHGAETHYYFAFGPTSAYGTDTATVGAGAGGADLAANAVVTGLSADTPYHYRIVATNSEGTTLGEDMTFRTAAAAQVAPGNVDGSPEGRVDLADAIVALKICAAVEQPQAVRAAAIDGGGKIGLPEAIYALQQTAEWRQPAALLQPSDFQYLGAFRLPDDGQRPLTFEYGGNAMTYNPDGNASGSEGLLPGSLFVMAHDRLPYDEMPDGNQIAEICIPAPAAAASPEGLPVASFIQGFHDALQGRFTDMNEIPKAGMQYLNHPETGAKLHVCWGQHIQPSEVPSHAWISSDLSAPDFQGSWFIGDQNLYSVNGYLFDIPSAWADANANGRCLATGRMRDGGQGGMGPALFAYRPWLEGGAAPAAGTPLAETALLLYGDVAAMDPPERALNGYQHADEWEGGAWVTTPTGKTAVLFAGTKATGSKYWYGYRNPLGPEHPCVDIHITDFVTCRNADGSPCPEEDFAGCCDESEENCISYRGWWSTRFNAQLILYDPADLAKVAAGTLDPWQPQPYATIDIDEHLFLDPPEWDVINIGEGDQRRYRIGAAAYDRHHGYLYVLELYADGAKPVVHVWKLL